MQSSIRSDSFPGPLNEARAASTAGGGTGLTTTAAIVGLPNGTTHVTVVATTFAGGAAVVKIALNPYLLILRSNNGLGVVTDFSVQGQQPGGTGITLDALDTLVNGGMLYIGSHVPFRGAQVTMSASVNSNASTLLVEFWNGSAWTAVSGFVDGTSSGGATFAQTGNVTWTVPTTWAKAFPLRTRSTPVDVSLQEQMAYSDKPRFWSRWSVSAKLSNTVKANTMFSLNRSTAYAEMIANSLLQYRTDKAVDGTGCVELLTDVGTAKAIVNVFVASPSGAF